MKTKLIMLIFVYQYTQCVTVEFNNQTNNTYVCRLNITVGCGGWCVTTVPAQSTAEFSCSGACAVAGQNIECVIPTHNIAYQLNDECCSSACNDLYKNINFSQKLSFNLNNPCSRNILYINSSGITAQPLTETIAKALQEVNQKINQGIDFVKATADIDRLKIKDSDYLQSRWVTPPDSIPLEKAVFVGSHNSFSYPPVFDRYYQQLINIEQQLSYGVRGFMPDTHWHNNQVLLCHNQCDGAVAFGQTGSINPKYQTFADFLQTIKKFLDKNPQEIIFIFLENYAPLAELDKAIESIPNLVPLLCTETQWQQYDLNNNAHITVGQLRKDNKRLFIFNFDSPTRYIMRQWNKVEENQYSTIQIPQVCKQRDESSNYTQIKRPLLLMNLFKEVTANIEESISINSYNSIDYTVKKCFNNFGNRLPNFIFLDHIDACALIKKDGKKDVFDWVNEKNKQ